MMVKNISGGPVHFPAAGVGDVADGEVVEVPDDTALPAEYFEQVTDKQDKPAAKSSSKE
jgi:hypothetical protein